MHETDAVWTMQNLPEHPMISPETFKLQIKTIYKIVIA